MGHSIGEKPGKGRYCCEHHPHWCVTLDDDDDRLPPCPQCAEEGSETTYVRR